MGIFALFTYIFLIRPEFEQAGAIKEKYDMEKQRIDVLEAYALSHPSMDQYLFELDKKLHYVDKMLPNEILIHEFITQLEQSSKKSNVQLLHLKPGQIINKNQYREIPVEIAIKGDYFHILEFLKGIENNDRFAMISKMSLQSQASLLEARMTITIYSFGISPTPVQSESK